MGEIIAGRDPVNLLFFKLYIPVSSCVMPVPTWDVHPLQLLNHNIFTQFVEAHTKRLW